MNEMDLCGLLSKEELVFVGEQVIDGEPCELYFEAVKIGTDVGTDEFIIELTVISKNLGFFTAVTFYYSLDESLRFLELYSSSNGIQLKANQSYNSAFYWYYRDFVLKLLEITVVRLFCYIGGYNKGVQLKHSTLLKAISSLFKIYK